MGGQKQKKREIRAERTEFAQFCAMAFGELWYLLKLNLLFLTACIPIMTVPMAVTAGLRITSSLAAGKQPPLWRAFCSAFFGEWKRALACGWGAHPAAGAGWVRRVCICRNDGSKPACAASAHRSRIDFCGSFLLQPLFLFHAGHVQAFPAGHAAQRAHPCRFGTLAQPCGNPCSSAVRRGVRAVFSGYAAARHTPSACACAACGFLRNQAGP